MYKKYSYIQLLPTSIRGIKYNSYILYTNLKTYLHKKEQYDTISFESVFCVNRCNKLLHKLSQ